MKRRRKARTRTVEPQIGSFRYDKIRFNGCYCDKNCPNLVQISYVYDINILLEDMENKYARKRFCGWFFLRRPDFDKDFKAIHYRPYQVNEVYAKPGEDSFVRTAYCVGVAGGCKIEDTRFEIEDEDVIDEVESDEV